MTSLLDVGVWLAAAWSGHARHHVVGTCFDEQNGDLVLCRVAQMGLLRLLSNPAVMRDDVLTRSDAWQVVDQFRSDDRVRWLAEPPHLEPVWRAISARDDQSHKLWTDDYLAAFAQTAALTVVTLDAGFTRRYPSVVVTTL